MTLVKRQAMRLKAPTARPRTQRVYVKSPTVPGHSELVRVVDTIEAMWRRDQIGQRDHQAAQNFGDAWDAIHPRAAPATK
jgi:hypothetical protein